ncbi:MAG TPA: GNAT family N-acetyltransferase [Candidatus Dormibacteraeota bacterium]|nr:GNAT family N-acetyltransferase [Candidatus Dormibacteraeota bacterium]
MIRSRDSLVHAVPIPARWGIVLGDGVRVQLRAVDPAGRGAPLAELERVDAGDEERFALVAVDPAAPDRPIGMAYYLRSSITLAVAEMSVVVADSWRRRGLGTILVAAVAEVAAQSGVRALLVEVPATNAPVVRILRRFGAEISAGGGEGVLDAHVNLPNNRNAFRDVIRAASGGRPQGIRPGSGWMGPAITVMGESVRFGTSVVELQTQWALAALTLLAPRTA